MVNEFSLMSELSFSVHLKVLVEHLCGDVDSGEPATVAGVGVVPPDGVLHPANLIVKSWMNIGACVSVRPSRISDTSSVMDFLEWEV